MSKFRSFQKLLHCVGICSQCDEALRRYTRKDELLKEATYELEEWTLAHDSVGCGDGEKYSACTTCRLIERIRKEINE